MSNQDSCQCGAIDTSIEQQPGAHFYRRTVVMFNNMKPSHQAVFVKFPNE